MNPGLVVKLRPSGPWRIGPDSGARNRVDAIYHSDSLYSALTSAMARLGSLEEWLDATARSPEPAVCFGSCFPFLDDIPYVVPPRTAWPPASPAISARVRWKSARFVPLSIVQTILAGRKLDENRWIIDGPSECLAPAGTAGPFRTAVRWSAAVDRLTGATERHSTACLEFRSGCGLWTVVSFADEAARDRWQEPVKAAFRLLADTGFGGERSRGWGRSEPPEFVEGTLPEMILPAIGEAAAAPAVEKAPQEPVVEVAAEAESQAPVALIAEVPSDVPQPCGAGASACQGEVPSEAAPTVPVDEPVAEPAEAEASAPAPSEVAPLIVESAEAAPEPKSPAAGLTDESVCPTMPPEGGAGASACQDESPSEAAPTAPVDEPVAEPAEAEASVQAPSEVAPLMAESVEAPPEPEPAAAGLTDESVCATAPPEVSQESGAVDEPAAEPAQAEATEACGAGASACQDESVCPTTSPEGEAAAAACQPAPESIPVPVQAEAPAPPVAAPGFENARPHWLLSLFAPAPTDAVDWKRGNYAVLSRGGRVESPAGSGELKKQVHMVAEGSVLFAAPSPRGVATDVAPEGFAHPVYRAGFAVAIPLSKVS